MSLSSIADTNSKAKGCCSFNFWMLPLCVAVALLCLSLGFWQLDRADQKRLMLASMEFEPVSLSQAGQSEQLLKASGYVPVIASIDEVSGQFLLLDNQIVNSKVGYDLLVPVRVGSGWLLANFGWVPAPNNTRELPSVVFDAWADLTGNINGILRYLPESFTLSKTAEVMSQSDPRIQGIDFALASTYFGVKFEPALLEITEPTIAGVTPNQPALVTMTPERHLGYAIQWFALSLTVIVLSFLLFRGDGR